MIEVGLVYFLRNGSYVPPFVGSGNNARIHPLVLPQKVPGGDIRVPALVYTLTADNEGRSYCGTDTLVENIVVIDCYAPTLLEARKLSKALRKEIVDYRGLMGAVNVRDVSLRGSLTLPDIDPGLMRVADTFSIWYEQE
jgi:hypothetical protein